MHSSLGYPGGTPKVLQEHAPLMIRSVVGIAYGSFFFVSDSLRKQICGMLSDPSTHMCVDIYTMLPS